MPESLHINFDSFREPGLYLALEDDRILTLTPRFIEEMKQRYLNDPVLLPRAVREAPAYAPCSVCPKRDSALICHAIPAVFPFIEEMDRFLSCEKITAVFRSAPEDGEKEGILQVAHTTAQRALQHVAILSLMYYCEVGLRYFKYFSGVMPLMSPMDIVERVYLNIFWDLNGDLTAIRSLIAKMNAEMEITNACQMSRLRLFCRSDAFVNAFINANVITQFLHSDVETVLRERFESRVASLAEPE